MYTNRILVITIAAAFIIGSQAILKNVQISVNRLLQENPPSVECLAAMNAA